MAQPVCGRLLSPWMTLPTMGALTTIACYNVHQCATIWPNFVQRGEICHSVAKCGTAWQSVVQNTAVCSMLCYVLPSTVRGGLHIPPGKVYQSCPALYQSAQQNTTQVTHTFTRSEPNPKVNVNFGLWLVGTMYICVDSQQSVGVR